jgi:amidase
LERKTTLKSFPKRALLMISVLLATFQAAPVAAQPSAFHLEEATIADIHAAFRAGTLTCTNLTQMYLDRILAYDKQGPNINSIITINTLALQTAAEMDRAWAASGPTGPLHCIPVLLKDNVNTWDMPTSNGSWILRDAIAPDDASIAAALRSAGALILAKASMGEFAGGSYNSVTGQVTNPYHLKRQTGGSSAGSGAAIAANFGVLAIGTDTSTSVRGPSAYNGIVGLRPTTGLISRDGIAPKNINFDSAGPMARTVADVAAMYSVVAFPDPADADGLSQQLFAEHPELVGLDYTRFLRRGALRGARLGAIRDFWGGDPEIDALADAAIARMRALGAEIVEIDLDPEFLNFFVVNGGPNIRTIADYRFQPDWEGYLATFGPEVPKTVADFIAIYENVVSKSPLPVEDSVMSLLRRSIVTSTDDPAYINLMENLLPAATEFKMKLFEQYRLDALVFPYQTSFGGPISNPAFSIPDDTFVRSNRPQPTIFAPYSSVGFPGLVVPMGFGSQGLPMDISFMGKPFEEGKLLSYGYDYEQATKLRAPSPLVPPLPGEM